MAKNGATAFSKIIESVRPKFIGISIVDGHLTALELKRGVFYTAEVPKTPDSPSIWENRRTLKALVKKVYKAAGIRLWTYRPIVVISTPANTPKQVNKEIYNTVLDAGARTVYLMDDFLMAALGSGVYQKDEGPAYNKKIYVLIQEEATYLGIILAGGTFELREIAKGYDNLTSADLETELTQLLNNFPTEVPPQFHHQSIKKVVAEELEKAWRRKPEKRVYLTAPQQYQGKWNDRIGGYDVVYSGEGERAIPQGIEQFLPVLVPKRSPLGGNKPISPMKIYVTLLLIILVVLVYSLVKK